MGAKYIYNSYRSDIKLIVKDPKTLKVLGTFIFPRYVRDRMTGQVKQTGYSKLTAEQYKLIVDNSQMFANLVKTNKITVNDKAPVTSNGFEKIQELNGVIKELKTENEALKKDVESTKSCIMELFAMDLTELKSSAKEFKLSVSGNSKAAYIEAIASVLCGAEVIGEDEDDSATKNEDDSATKNEDDSATE